MRDIVTGGFKKKKATLQHVVCPASYAVGFFNIGWNNRSGWWSQALVERGRRRGEGGDGIAEEIVSVVVVVVSRRLYRTNRWNTRKYLFSSCHEQATLPAFPTQAEADRYTWVYLGELPRNTTVGCTGTRSLSFSTSNFLFMSPCTVARRSKSKCSPNSAPCPFPILAGASKQGVSDLSLTV